MHIYKHTHLYIYIYIYIPPSKFFFAYHYAIKFHGNIINNHLDLDQSNIYFNILVYKLTTV